MSKGFVLLGDKTTHGGQVLSASSTIIEGSPEWSSDGKAIAVEGCRCECGCQLISSAPDCVIG